MKMHDWRSELVKASGGCTIVEEARKCIRFLPHRGPGRIKWAELQSIHGDYVGLQVNVPNAYNKQDAEECKRVAIEMGFMQI